MWTDDMQCFLPSFPFLPGFQIMCVPLLLSLLFRLPPYGVTDHYNRPLWMGSHVGRLPYWGRLMIILEWCHIVFQGPNLDATEEDIKNPYALNCAMLYFPMPAGDQIMRWNKRIYNPWNFIWACVVPEAVLTRWSILFASFQETHQGIESQGLI